MNWQAIRSASGTWEETADVGDVVRTIAVNGTMTARWPKDRLITNDKIKAGDVIIGCSSSGQATYETEYNSGIGSNGLTSARHDTLHKTYGARFPESYDTGLDDSVVYIGPHRMTDPVEIRATSDIDRLSAKSSGWSTDIGHLLLSPTRTYAPLLRQLLTERFDLIHGLIHCSGGGQTKCMKYLPGNFLIVKDNLFDPPPVFRLIQDASGSDDREMYQVFNMGHRLEIFATRLPPKRSSARPASLSTPGWWSACKLRRKKTGTETGGENRIDPAASRIYPVTPSPAAV